MHTTNSIPPGCNHNPSAWRHRLPLILAAIAGACIAAYLSLFQLNVIQQVWDPFFGGGSEQILTSSFANALPVPDALLGAFAYGLDAVLGSVGSSERWRTAPWIVVLFGVTAAMMCLTSIVLVISQPFFFKAWCTLCLCCAAISFIIVRPASIELMASLRYLQRVKRSGQSVWHAFRGAV